MSRSARVALLLVSAALGVGVLWWLLGHRHGAGELTLFGNIDQREIELPFNGSERIAEVLALEGDHVKQGQLLARLDTSRLDAQFARAQADVAAQQQAVERLHRGNRPEEIAQARANEASAAADAGNARAQYERLQALSSSSSGRAVSRQDMDSAATALATADARLDVSRKALALEVLGPRKEDIAQGEAQLRADEAQLALVRQQLKDAELRAPVDAVVRSRIVEPGEISSPQKAAFTLAIINPKWVRAYVSESELGAVREGMPAAVSVDAFPGRRFPAWVGFISPTAEFTPKSVETTELRASLVYEVRVFVRDPQDELRLGMPATVHLTRAAAAAPPPAGAPPKHSGGS